VDALTAKGLHANFPFFCFLKHGCPATPLGRIDQDDTILSPCDTAIRFPGYAPHITAVLPKTIFFAKPNETVARYVSRLSWNVLSGKLPTTSGGMKLMSATLQHVFDHGLAGLVRAADESWRQHARRTTAGPRLAPSRIPPDGRWRNLSPSPPTSCTSPKSALRSKTNRASPPKLPPLAFSLPPSRPACSLSYCSPTAASPSLLDSTAASRPAPPFPGPDRQPHLDSLAAWSVTEERRMNGQQAYKYLRRTSRQRRIPLSQFAEDLLGAARFP
jgi:hypothetical protein